MIQALKRTFALTESGAKGLLKASFYSALMPLAYILPMMIVMLFAQGVLEGGLQPMPFFIASIAIVVLIMYIILYAAYNAQYRETYNESANLRIEVANILKSLPLSYFSKHDISDLSQVILADVAAIEHAMSHANSPIVRYGAVFTYYMLCNVCYERKTHSLHYCAYTCQFCHGIIIEKNASFGNR